MKMYDGSIGRPAVRLAIGCVIAVMLAISCGDKSEEPESQETSIGLPANRVKWVAASEPLQVNQGASRARILWHSAPGIAVTDVFDIDPAQGENVLYPFRVVFRPLAGESSWAGITSHVGIDLVKKKSSYLYVTVKGTHGVLHFDLGSISEDANGNGIADHETIPHGGPDPSEWDVGLDGHPDEMEPGYDPDTNCDPSHDDWFFQGSGKCPLIAAECNNDSVRPRFFDMTDSLYYEFLNGTEGNAYDIARLGQADNEQLSPAGFNLSNAYLSFDYDLATDSSSSEAVELIPASYRNSWRTFRVRLDALIYMVDDGTRDPSLADVSHIRVWFESDGASTRPDTVQIARWYFDVGTDTL